QAGAEGSVPPIRPVPGSRGDRVPLLPPCGVELVSRIARGRTLADRPWSNKGSSGSSLAYVEAVSTELRLEGLGAKDRRHCHTHYRGGQADPQLSISSCPTIEWKGARVGPTAAVERGPSEAARSGSKGPTRAPFQLFTFCEQEERPGCSLFSFVLRRALREHEGQAGRPSIPFQGPLLPCIPEPHQQDSDEQPHFQQPEEPQLAELHRPGKHEHDLDIENNEEHADDVVPDRKLKASVRE